MSLKFGDGETLAFQNKSELIKFIQSHNAAGVSSADYSMDTSWMVINTALVFTMQAGFALLEVGSIKMKNTKNILVKIMLDACISALSFWLVGYGFAFGGGSSFIGEDGFALKTFDHPSPIKGGKLYNGKDYAFFIFHWAYTATAATIISGALAERCSLFAYLLYSTTITAFTYPVVVHWAWSSTGWASTLAPKEDRLFGVGAIDFAGSTVVHMTGGLMALVGTAFLGPRTGRFVDGKAQDMVFQSSTLQTLGTLLLWFGWYGFNCGSTLSVTGVESDVAGKVATTMTICAASGGATAAIIGFIAEKHVDISRINNGILAGLVSITAGCSVVDVELAFVIGIIGAIIYYFSAKLLLYLGIDDVVDAAPVHFFCGMWGTLAVGLFAEPNNVQMAFKTGSCGAFYTCNGNGGKQLGANLVLILASIAWVGLFAVAIFGLLRMLKMLRVSDEMEKLGLDLTEHGGVAYEVQKKPLVDTEPASNESINNPDNSGNYNTFSEES